MARPINRREMLRRSATAGSAAILLTNGILARGASPNEKLDIAVIGLGGRGGANLNGVSGENVVALCDVDDERAGKAYEKFSKAKKFYDFRVMLDEMEKQIDAVVISTPDHTHFHPAMMAMERGLHCYCEKPMAHAVSEVRAMTDLARKKGLATQLGVQRHTIPNMHRVVELIKSGTIGEICECHAWVGGERGMPDVPSEYPPVPANLKWDLWLGPAADRPYSPAYVPYNWRFWWDFGTGEMGNWGCHILDIPYWALDLKYCTKVIATGPEVDTQRTPRSMAVRYEFPARGDHPPVVLNWYHTKSGPAILKELGISGKGANNLFIGSEGMLLCGFNSHVLLPEDKFADFERPEKAIPDSPGFYKEWIDAPVRGARRPPATSIIRGRWQRRFFWGTSPIRTGQAFEWNAAEMKSPGCSAIDALNFPTYRKGWEV
jgi:predicted dehydrogenase